ncbi:MAG TPA: hypothetical protein HA326_08915, partial [Thermoplasmata archaeon]|nr:hypothetical protein [Thermoplasmata archaeon]
LMGWKDIVKVEDRELAGREIDKIALIAPTASVNVIRNYNVAEKRRVTLPDRAVGILKCGNPNCISNTKEPVESEFLVRSKNPLRVFCKFCDRELEDIPSHIVYGGTGTTWSRSPSRGWSRPATPGRRTWWCPMRVPRRSRGKR